MDDIISFTPAPPATETKKTSSLNIIELKENQMMGKKPILTPTSGTWICGGAIRQWFVGDEPSSDIDVFGQDEEALEKFVATEMKNFPSIGEHKYATSYMYNGQLVQIMNGFKFSTMEETFDNFDFTVCQFGWDGKKIFASLLGIISVLRKHLGVHKIQKEFAADSLRRAFKYQRKGYIPCAATIRDIGLSFVDLEKKDIESQVQVSPGGGLVMVGID